MSECRGLVYSAKPMIRLNHISDSFCVPSVLFDIVVNTQHLACTP